MFYNHVYITTSDDLQKFDLYFSYKEYFNHRVNDSSILKPSKLSSGYTLRNKNIGKEYFDNLIINRFNNVYISRDFILPKIDFIDKYDSINLDFNIEVIISNEKYNTHENNNSNNDEDEAIMLIFPPKKYCNEYFGGNIILKIEDNEYRIDTTQFSYQFYTIIIYNKIDVIFEPILKGFRCIFKSVIRYNDNTIVDL
jgi:hypothetical protein